MPTYVYKFIDTGETIEVQQAFTDPTLTKVRHPSDGRLKKVKKVFQPVGVTFKGTGFYKTDSRGGSSKSSTTANGESPSSSSSESASTGSSSGDTKSSDTKSSDSKSSGSKSDGTASSAKPAKADKKTPAASAR